MSVLDIIFVNWNGRMQLRKHVDSATHFHKVDERFERFKVTHPFYSLTNRVMHPQRHYFTIFYILLIIGIMVELLLRVFQYLIGISWTGAQNILIACPQLTGCFLWRR